VHKMRTGSIEARYCRVMKEQRTSARKERQVGQPTAACPKCKKLVSPPERLAEHFPRCERRATLKPSVLFR
jgi:hypothetical protein